jgi:ATP-dependent Clp protease ATP-binding subunit ClpX
VFKYIYIYIYIYRYVLIFLIFAHQNADFNVEAAEQGIIFLDEIDKIAKRSSFSNHRDVGGEGVQQALLKMLEGMKVSLTDKFSKKNPKGDTFMIDTSNILFILSGAFQGLDKIVQERVVVNVRTYQTIQLFDCQR